MNVTELQVRQTVWSATLYTAERLGMTRRDGIENLLEGQLVMVATPHGMNIGNIKRVYEETETSRHEKYYLNEILLYELNYDTPVSNWGDHPTTVSHLPKEVVIYVSY